MLAKGSPGTPPQDLGSWGGKAIIRLVVLRERVRAELCRSRALSPDLDVAFWHECQLHVAELRSPNFRVEWSDCEAWLPWQRGDQGSQQV